MKSMIAGLAAALLTTSPALAQETIEVPSDQSFSVRVVDLPTDCQGSEDLHLSIAGTTLAIDRRMVSVVTPAKVSARGSPDSSEVVMMLPKDAGCAASPFEAVVAMLEFQDADLPLGVGIAAIQAGISQHVADMRDSGQCPSLDPGRLACAGNFPSPDGPIPVVAVIASDPLDLASDGVPLFVVCQPLEEGVACEASGFRSGIMFKAVVVQPTPPDVDQMRRMYVRIDDLFAGWQAGL